MRSYYALVKDAVKNGSTPEQVKGIPAKSRFYDQLFPTAEQYLEKRWQEAEKNKAKKSKKNNQTQLLGEEADSQENAETVEKKSWM
jgi:hypothetical protein